MFGNGKDTHPDFAKLPNENPSRLRKTSPRADRGDSRCRTNFQCIPKTRRSMVHDVIVCQAENANARLLDAIDARVRFTEGGPRLCNRRRLFDERTFQVCDGQIRVFELHPQVVEKTFGIASLEIREVATDGTNVRSYENSRHV